VLSHAHIDHCGNLPNLVRRGFRGPIFCTPATRDLIAVMLADSAKIQEEDAEYLNRRQRGPGEEQVQPLYRSTDAAAVLKLWKKVPYEQKTDLGKGVSFTFFNAGHILGSAYIVLEFSEEGRTKRLLFTGDVGRYNAPILRDPQPIPGVFDYLITESTYGGKTHAPMEQVGPQLLDAVKYCIEHRSRLLVPAFAVGRTQTMLWYMQRFIQSKEIPNIPIYVDSPMGVAVSRVHSEFRASYDEETAAAIGNNDLFGASQVHFASSTQESRQINSQAGPCVIIASSPTCEFGRILHHLKQSLERPDDVVIFVGWVPPGTLGRRLQDNQKRVKIYDRFYDVRCQIRTIHGLSAHADGNELIRFLTPTLKENTIGYVVHGEEDQAEIFARRLLDAGLGEAMVPAMESSVITAPEGVPAEVERQDVASDGD
jgi:metallo-beta-lactamase family protein